MSSSEDELPTFTWSAEAGTQSDSSSQSSTFDDGGQMLCDRQLVWGEPDIHCSNAQWPIFESDDSDSQEVEPSTFNFKSLEKPAGDSSNWNLTIRFPSNQSSTTELGTSAKEPIVISSTEPSSDSEYEGHDDHRPGPSTSRAPDQPLANLRAQRFPFNQSSTTELGTSAKEPIVISSTESSSDSEYEDDDDHRPGPSTSRAPDQPLVNLRAQTNYKEQDRCQVSAIFKIMYKGVVDRIDAAGPSVSSSSDGTVSSSSSNSSMSSNSRPLAVTEEYVELVMKTLYQKDGRAQNESSEDENADQESDHDYWPSDFDYETSQSLDEESDDSIPQAQGVPSYVSVSPHGSPPSPPSTDEESGYDTDDGQFSFRLPRGAAGLVLLPAPVPGHDIFIAHAFGLDGRPLMNEAGGRPLHPGEWGEHRQEERQNRGQGLTGHVQLQGQVDEAQDRNDVRALPIIPANPDQIVALANQRERLERNMPEHNMPVQAHNAAAFGHQGQAIPQAAPLVVQQRIRPVPVPLGRRNNPQRPISRDRPVSRRSCSTQTSRRIMSSPKQGPSTRPDSPLSRSSSLTSLTNNSTSYSSTGGGDLTSSTNESVFFSSDSEGAGDSIPDNQVRREMIPGEPTGQSGPRSGVTTTAVPSTRCYTEAKSTISSGSSTAPEPGTSTGSYTLYGSALRLSQSTSRRTAKAAASATQPSTSGITSSRQRRLSPSSVEAEDESSEDGCGRVRRKIVRGTNRMTKKRREKMTEDWEDRRLVAGIKSTLIEPCNILPYEKRKRCPSPCEKIMAEADIGHCLTTTSCSSPNKRTRFEGETVLTTSKLNKSAVKKRRCDSDHELPPWKRSRTEDHLSNCSEGSPADIFDSGYTDDTLVNDDIDHCFSD